MFTTAAGLSLSFLTVNIFINLTAA